MRGSQTGKIAAPVKGSGRERKVSSYPMISKANLLHAISGKTRKEEEARRDAQCLQRLPASPAASKITNRQRTNPTAGMGFAGRLGRNPPRFSFHADAGL